MYRPTKQKTFDMPVPHLTREVQEKIGALISTSGMLYSRPRSVVENEIRSNGLDTFGRNQINNSTPPANLDDNVSVWGV